MLTSTSVSLTAVPIMCATRAATAAADFFAVIDAHPEDVSGLKEPEVSSQKDIVLDGVTFAYPSRPHTKVLDDLSLRFPTGKLTAIVGSSGSGKSTIVGLLERWYELENDSKIVIPPSALNADEKSKTADNDKDETRLSIDSHESTGPVCLSGTIKIGGHDLHDIDLKWWRSQIGLVQQEPFIFNDTIYKNVEQGLIGSPWENENAETKRKLVIEACKEAFADEYIIKLPLVCVLMSNQVARLTFMI